MKIVLHKGAVKSDLRVAHLIVEPDRGFGSQNRVPFFVRAAAGVV